MRRALAAGMAVVGLLAVSGCASQPASSGSHDAAQVAAQPASAAADDSIKSFIKGSWHCMHAKAQYIEFNLFGSTYGIGSGEFEGEATFTDTTFKMGAGDSFLTGTWTLKDGSVTLTADDGAKQTPVRAKTTTVSNFPSSTAQLQNKIRVSLQSAGTNDEPYNFAYIQADGPKSVVITGAQNRQANCTKD